MNIGTLLRKLRDSRALTTRTIAEKTGVSLSTYVDWEHDKSSPSLKSFVKLAAAFDVNPVDFLAYLTGQVTEVFSSEQKVTMEETERMVNFYKEHPDQLKKE